MAYPDYVVIFRGRRACPCLAEWLPYYERMLLKAGVIKKNIDVAQLIGGASASAGTHTRGGAYDIWQRSSKAIEIAREMGAAAWARGRPFAPHQHGVLRGCPHNGPARYQVVALDKYDGNGLGAGGRGGRDNGPAKHSDRDWRDGIAWAKAQLNETPEDDMPTPEEFWTADVVVAPAGDESTWQVQSILSVLARESLKQTELLEQLIKAQGGDADPKAPEPEPQEPAADTYTVKSGDTLSKIGAALDIDWHDLAEWNGLKSPYTINPGDKLKTKAPKGGGSPKG